MWCVDGEVSLEARPVRQLAMAGKGKGTKNAGAGNRKAQKTGAFLGAQQAGDEKTGARGRRVRAREAH